MTPGERFATAFAAKDRAGLRDVLAEDVDFLGLTPGRHWEASTVDDLLAILLGTWVEDRDRVDELVYVQAGDDVVDTHRVAYRLALTTPAGPHVMEQQAYYRTDGDRITYLRVMCSGFRPTS
ncbi:MAG TPA: hypothetical protein VFK41_11395 [Nocardioidaceae bacterium]|nr:hypothetical protein [Nocardioidaceae bacterium]